MTVERVARATGLSADAHRSVNEGLREWRQVDPPLAGRELSYLVGRLDRSLVEGPLLDLAQRRGLDCTVEESAVCSAFVSRSRSPGPAYKLDEFADHARYVVRSNQNWFTSGP